MRALSRLALLIVSAFIFTCAPLKTSPNSSLGSDDALSLQDVANSNNQFAFDLYAIVKKDGANTYISPFSLSSALSMLWAGAAENSEIELAKALHLDGKDKTAVLKGIKALNESYSDDTAKRFYQFKNANRLFGEKSFNFKQPYLNLSKEYFSAELEPLDFRIKADDSRKMINDWVATQTNQKILDLLPSGSLTRDARLVLVNAIYFKGKWMAKFDATETLTDQVFFNENGTKGQVSLMQAEGTNFYAEDDEYAVQVLQRNFVSPDPEGCLLSLVVLLPKPDSTLAKLETKLNADIFKNLVQKVAPTTVKVMLPKFVVHDGMSDTVTKAALTKLGVKDLFNQLQANLTGIADDPNQERLYLSKVVQKTFAEINEAGMESAAASAAASYRVTSAPIDEPKLFKADRPFLYAIRDIKTGLILFMGRYSGPK